MTGEQTDEHPKLPHLPEVVEDTPAAAERAAPSRSGNGDRSSAEWPPPLEEDPDRLERARRLFEDREAELARRERDRRQVAKEQALAEEEKREAFISAELTKAAEALESARRAQLPQGADLEPYVDVVEHLRKTLALAEAENNETVHELRLEVGRLQETIRRAKRKLLAQKQALHEQTERSDALSEALRQVQNEHTIALSAVREESQAHWHAREQALMRQVKKDYEALIDNLDDAEDRRLAKQEAARSLAALEEAASETDAPRRRGRAPDAGGQPSRRARSKQQPRKTARSTKKLPPAKPRARKRAPRASG